MTMYLLQQKKENVMKTQLFAAVSCLLLFSVTSYAQPPAPNFAQMRQSPAMQQVMKNGMKTGLRSFWNGQGTNLLALGSLSDPDIRSALNVSDEQYQKIQEAPMQIGMTLQTHPEGQKLMEEMQAVQAKNPGDPFMQNADEETQQKLFAIQAKIADLAVSTMSDAIGNIITPEQKQKMNESMLANMSEMPIAAPSMYEALNLTDDQKQQMEKIKKELEPEFEKNLDEFADGSMSLMDKMFAELEKQGTSIEQLAPVSGDREEMEKRRKEMQEKMQAIQKKLMEDPEYKKLSDKLQTQGQAFSSKFNTKMFDVLTDEQWARLQKLIDNPPEYAKVFGKKMKEQQGKGEKSAVYTPGPNSWQPGKPIPEEYRQERNTRGRFPRGTTETKE
jgi:hypothetical protein